MNPVDVGLQYEPITLNNTDPGWTIIFYMRQVSLTDGTGAPQNQVETNLRVWDASAPVPSNGMPWHSSANPIAGTMTFEALPSGNTYAGSAQFKFTGIAGGAPIYANFPRSQLAAGDQTRWDVDATNHLVAPWASSAPANRQMPLVVFDVNNYASANVKRVTAMTRDDPYTSELDGSRVVAAWTACRVQPRGGVFGTWHAVDVHQSATGYDVPRTGALAFDKRYNGQLSPDVRRRKDTSSPLLPVNVSDGLSRTIVQFSDNLTDNDAARAPISPTNPVDDGRYANETVTFNLGMIARPVGQAVH